uniref:Uncharacterized protein n=1 Tax=Ditylenchus dipsaci TaxID=166011 RepID=A0A915DTW0_9BILA
MTKRKKFDEFSKELGCSVEGIKNMFRKAEKVPVYGDVLRGDAYRDGHGVIQDFAKAAKFYNKAAEAGNAEAMYNLALLYRDGKGVEQNFETFLSWLLKAAQKTSSNGISEEGVMQAQHAMGLMHHEVTFLDGKLAQLCRLKGIQKGIEWLQQAANLGSQDASTKLKLIKTSKEFQQEIITRSILPDIPPEADPLNSKEHRDAVEKAAKKGSVTAGRILTIWRCMQEAMMAFKNDDNRKVLSQLAIAIRLDQQNVKIPQIFYEMIEQEEKTHPDNLEVLICYLHINSRGKRTGGIPNIMEFLDNCLRLFPHEPFFMESQIMIYETLNWTAEALNIVKTAIQYNKQLKDNFSTCQEAIQGVKRQARVSPKFTCSSKLRPSNKNHTNLSFVYNISFPDPQRCMYLNSNRKLFAGLEEKKSSKNCFLSIIKDERPKLIAQPVNFSSLKEILFSEMDFTQDKVYNNRFIEVIILDWPTVIDAVMTVAADKKRLHIYNWPNKHDAKELMKEFKPMQKLTIINPFFHITKDEMPVIDVKSREYLNFSSPLPYGQHCHCCGAQANTMKCQNAWLPAIAPKNAKFMTGKNVVIKLFAHI